MGRRNIRRSGAFAALFALIALLAVVPLAQAGTSAARATKPAYSDSAVRLSGTGAYAATGKSASISVTVCLQKRSGGSFINIRCNSATDTDHSVRTGVAVPGCVAGVWRTSAIGIATTKAGGTKLPASAVSPLYRCSGAKKH